MNGTMIETFITEKQIDESIPLEYEISEEEWEELMTEINLPMIEPPTEEELEELAKYFGEE